MEQEGGRIFFSTRGRSLTVEDEIELRSVGVDIGSSTTHLVFSRIVLERLDARYIVSERQVLHRSNILLTPYSDSESIDADVLRQFFDREYAAAGMTPDEVDTGALVLTGVAVRRKNARAIGDLFSGQAGKMVAVSAGDSLETLMAAFGSGAVARSIRDACTVVNVDIGGGTSKIAICVGGDVVDRTAVDIGARVISFDSEGRVARIEEAGRWFAREAGVAIDIGDKLSPEDAQLIADLMADKLIAVIEGRSRDVGASGLLRLEEIKWRGDIGVLTISGGVSEFFYRREQSHFGDLGPQLAKAFRARAEAAGWPIRYPDERIRATVIGASQYSTQLSGSTIFVDPMELLPLRNVPVISPELSLAWETLDSSAIARSVKAGLARMELEDGNQPVALFSRWEGSASFARLDAFCRGVLAGMDAILAAGHPLILVGDGDIGGLIGIHLKQEIGSPASVVSVDGLDLKPFDFIDIGDILPTSGAVPVVIKSLVFPADEGLGRPRVLQPAT